MHFLPKEKFDALWKKNVQRIQDKYININWNKVFATKLKAKI